MKYKTADSPLGKCTRVYELTEEGRAALQQQHYRDVHCGQLSLDLGFNHVDEFINYELALYWNWKSLSESEREEYGRPFRIL